MRGCKSKAGHDIKVTKDPEVQDQNCGMNEVWTVEGIKNYWLCCHQLKCSRCNRVVSQLVMCPENKAKEPQDRRWR